MILRAVIIEEWFVLNFLIILFIIYPGLPVFVLKEEC